MKFRPILSLLLLAWCGSAACGQTIEKIWIGFPGATPARITVSWVGENAGTAAIEFGTTAALGSRQEGTIDGRIHRATITMKSGTPLYYRVRSGAAASPIYRLTDAPSDELRVAVIGNAGYSKQPWAEAIQKERPHLLITAGDNVAALHNGKPVNPEDFTAFEKLIASAPELFATTPFLPALGNHDREICPRGPKPPAQPVYDVSATAFRRFFTLPDPEWTWSFAVPESGVRFVAVDLNHVSDFGTTWQTCHPFDAGAPQLSWYRDQVEESREPFLVTIYNEQNSRVRTLAGGEWERLIRRGSLAITGFGYFGERAAVDEFTFYNTSLNGTGSRYPDPKSTALHSADNFLLMRLARGGSMAVEMKDLRGALLDRAEIAPRGIPTVAPGRK